MSQPSPRWLSRAVAGWVHVFKDHLWARGSREGGRRSWQRSKRKTEVWTWVGPLEVREMEWRHTAGSLDSTWPWIEGIRKERAMTPRKSCARKDSG